MSLGGNFLKDNSFLGQRKLIPIVLIACALMGGYILDKVLYSENAAEPLAEDAFPQEVEIKYHTCYLKCGDIVTETVTLPAQDVQTYLADLSFQWEPLSEDGSVREFKKTQDDYCPVHSRFRFVTIYGGFVAVYRGKHAEQQQFFVQDFKHLPQGSLRDNERALLLKGVILEDEPYYVDAKVAKYLEGLVD